MSPHPLSLAVVLFGIAFTALSQTIHHGYVSYERTSSGSCTFDFDYEFTLHLVVDTSYPEVDSLELDFNEGAPFFATFSSTQLVGGKLKEITYSLEHHFLSCGSYPVYHYNPDVISHFINLSGDFNFNLQSIVTYTIFAENVSSVSFAGIHEIKGFVGENLGYQFEFEDNDGDSVSFELVSIPNVGYTLPEGTYLNNQGLFSWQNPLAIGQYLFAMNCSEWDSSTGLIVGNTVVVFTVSIANETGVFENPVKYFGVYPNPSNGKVSLQFLTNQPFKGVWCIQDLHGRNVYNESLDLGLDGIHGLPVQLRPGMYISVVSDGEDVLATEKLIVH